MKKAFILTTFLLLFVFDACTKKTIDPKIASIIINKNNISTIAEDLSKSTKVANEDIEYFISAITRFGDNPDSLIGKSVENLIEEEKIRNKNMLNESLLNTGSRITLFMNHKFRYVGIQFNDTNPEKKMNNIVFDIFNISDKNIKRVEGHLTFYDPSGKIVRVYNLATAATEIPISDTITGIRFSMPFIHGDRDTNPEIRRRDSLIRNAKDLNAV